MKKLSVLFVLFLLVPSVAHGWYDPERTTEQSFEQSGLYFKSHFLNTYGLLRFRDVAVGLIVYRLPRRPHRTENYPAIPQYAVHGSLLASGRSLV